MSVGSYQPLIGNCQAEENVQASNCHYTVPIIWQIFVGKGEEVPYREKFPVILGKYVVIISTDFLISCHHITVVNLNPSLVGEYPDKNIHTLMNVCIYFAGFSPTRDEFRLLHLLL
jgi:hypothetical protein